MLLLAPDTVDLYGPSTMDGYGWAEPADATAPAWSGVGNLQLTGGISDPRAGAGGGAGPYAPAADLVGQLFLPPEAPITDGTTVTCRGRRFVASQVHQVTDPVGGGLACIQATVTGVDQWPA